MYLLSAHSLILSKECEYRTLGKKCNHDRKLELSIGLCRLFASWSSGKQWGLNLPNVTLKCATNKYQHLNLIAQSVLNSEQIIHFCVSI